MTFAGYEHETGASASYTADARWYLTADAGRADADGDIFRGPR